jgi:hypothetical protein
MARKLNDGQTDSIYRDTISDFSRAQVQSGGDRQANSPAPAFDRLNLSDILDQAGEQISSRQIIFWKSF